jgi:hypothetical protein
MPLDPDDRSLRVPFLHERSGLPQGLLGLRKEIGFVEFEEDVSGEIDMQLGRSLIHRHRLDLAAEVLDVEDDVRDMEDVGRTGISGKLLRDERRSSKHEKNGQ